MKNKSIITFVAASLAFSVPQGASADLKDALIGGVAGAIIMDQVHKNKKKKVVRRQIVTKKKRYVAPSINSQYSRNERIQIQTALRNIGYNVGTVDGVLGKNSRYVIGQFQSSRGEAQTGQLTRPQFIALTSQGFQSPPVLGNRALSRDEVVLLQQGLQRLGFYTGGVDGSNGPGTRGATTQFLFAQGFNPAQTTQVQTVVLATTAAGLPTPPYLQQEANMQMAATNGGAQFGTPGLQQNGSTAPAQQQTGFGAANQQQNLFGAPAQQQQPGTVAPAANGTYAAVPANNTFGTQQPQAAAPANSLFGTQQQQAPQGGVAPANNQQNLFAPAPQQQQQAPQPSQQGNSLFASGDPNAPAQAVPQQQPQSTLDVFTVNTAAPLEQVDQTQVAVQQPNAAAPSDANSLFATPNAAFAATVQQGQTGNGSLDVTATPSN